MTKVLVLSASGQIARWVIDNLATDKQIDLTLFLRNARTLHGRPPATARVVQGDVLDRSKLAPTMAGQDIVYCNLTGDDLDVQAEAVVSAMKAAGVKRLVFVSSLGIYDEIPGKFGEWNRREIGAFLPPFRRAADTLEASGLDYTVIRPAWLTDADERPTTHCRAARSTSTFGSTPRRRPSCTPPRRAWAGAPAPRTAR